MGDDARPIEERQQQVLKAVVHEFTQSGVPVGSQALVSRYFLNLSSATIRHELAELVEHGYLVQPHTSAGRVPTDQGYRYFVDFLMDTEPVPRNVRAYIDEELRSAPADTQSLVERAATTIANVTQNASLVTAPSGAIARIKHVDLVSLEPRLVLLILLVEGNVLRQQVVKLNAPAAQDRLSKLAQRVNHELAGKNRDDIAVLTPKGLEKEVLTHIEALLQQLERGGETMVVHDGVRNLLAQPEFSEATRIKEVLEVLEESRYLAGVLQQLVADADVQIVIGSENVTSQLRTCTVMLTTYGPSPRVKGVLGVIGPTRMRYGQVVGRLRAVAKAASQRMAQLSA